MTSFQSSAPAATKRLLYSSRVSSLSHWLLLLGICLLAILVRWPSLDQPFDNDGGARAYHARLILGGEPLYSTHHTGHHLPAVYYTYALAMALFGDSAWAVKFFLILWTIPTVILLHRLGLVAFEQRIALLAALFYAVLSAHLWLWGQTAETELFANLPRIAAIWWLIRLFRSQAPPWHYFGVGLLGALAFLYKAIYLSPLAMAGVVILVALWQDRDRAGIWRTSWARGFAVVVGFLAGLLPVALYFGLQGLLPRLLQVFSLGQSYLELTTLNPDAGLGAGAWIWYPILPLFGLAFNNAVLLIYSLAGLLFIVLLKKYRRVPALFIAIWYLLSFVEAGANLELFAHYYLLIVPALSLLAAWFLMRVYDDVRRSRWGAAPLPALIAGALLALALALSFSQNFNYLTHFVQYKRGEETVTEFVRAGWPGFGERLARSVALADYIRLRTNPQDAIYYWSEDVQLYYNSDRRSPIDTIWPIDVAATGPVARIFEARTRYVVIDRQRDPGPPAWLSEALSTQYRLETVLDEQAIYRRVTTDE